MLMCVWPQKHYLFLFLQNFKRWKGRVIWSNNYFFTTFFCLGGRSWVQGPESSPAFFNRICPKHNMTSRQDNTMHKRQDDMTSRQDDMTNSIMESRPIETFASKCKFVCQSKQCLLLIVGGNWWNIFVILETIEEQKVSERSSWALLKCVAWLNQLQHFS